MSEKKVTLTIDTKTGDISGLEKIAEMSGEITAKIKRDFDDLGKKASGGFLASLDSGLKSLQKGLDSKFVSNINEVVKGLGALGASGGPLDGFLKTVVLLNQALPTLQGAMGAVRSIGGGLSSLPGMMGRIGGAFSVSGAGSLGGSGAGIGLGSVGLAGSAVVLAGLAAGVMGSQQFADGMAGLASRVPFLRNMSSTLESLHQSEQRLERAMALRNEEERGAGFGVAGATRSRQRASEIGLETATNRSIRGIEDEMFRARLDVSGGFITSEGAIRGMSNAYGREAAQQTMGRAWTQGMEGVGTSIPYGGGIEQWQQGFGELQRQARDPGNYGSPEAIARAQASNALLGRATERRNMAVGTRDTMELQARLVGGDPAAFAELARRDPERYEGMRASSSRARNIERFMETGFMPRGLGVGMAGASADDRADFGLMHEINSISEVDALRDPELGGRRLTLMDRLRARGEGARRTFEASRGVAPAEADRERARTEVEASETERRRAMSEQISAQRALNEAEIGRLNNHREMVAQLRRQTEQMLEQHQIAGRQAGRQLIRSSAGDRQRVLGIATELQAANREGRQANLAEEDMEFAGRFGILQPGLNQNLDRQAQADPMIAQILERAGHNQRGRELNQANVAAVAEENVAANQVAALQRQNAQLIQRAIEQNLLPSMAEAINNVRLGADTMARIRAGIEGVARQVAEDLARSGRVPT